MHSHMRETSAGLRTLGCGVVLFLVNFYVCRSLFRIEYLNQMGSIEAAFVSLARYINGNWRDLTWFPLWYDGIPYQDTYPPLLHWAVALTSMAVRLSPAHAYHVVVALLYCLAPVTLFALCLALSGSRAYSFFAGLIYSVLSPSAFIATSIARDIGFMKPRRLQTLVVYGEGPHLAGLVLLPLAALALHRAAARRSGRDMVLAAIAFAATVLTNWLAAVALFAVAAAYVSSAKRVTVYAVAIAILAYCMAAPWIPPSTIATIRHNAPLLGDYGGVYGSMPRNLAVLSIAFAAVVAATRRITDSLVVRFAAVFSFAMAALVIPAEYWKVFIVPQPHRYHLELELGLAILLPFAVKPLFDRAPQRARVAIAVVLLGAAVIPARAYRRYARYVIAPIDIQNTIEYKTAKWFDENMHGARVMALGSTAFWMNAFTDTPQMGGGFDNGIVNNSIWAARYVIGSDEGTGDRAAETSIVWLRAMGVSAIAVGGPNTKNAYKDFVHPRKFDGILPLAWQEGDDRVYLVPQYSRSLAHVMTRADLVSRAPYNGIDLEPMRPYVAALENPAYPAADFRWTSRHSAAISATLRPDDVISIQVTSHPGWHARVNGAVVRIEEDGLKHMFVEPRCKGACAVEIFYDGGSEMWVAWGLFAGAWILAGWALWRHGGLGVAVN